MDYQELFNYMSKEHGVDLLETDMREIVIIVEKMLLNNSQTSNEVLTLSNNEHQKKDFVNNCTWCGEPKTTWKWVCNSCHELFTKKSV